MHFVSVVDDQLAHTTYVTDFHRFVVETFLLEVQVKNAGPSELVDEIINVAYTVLYLASVDIRAAWSGENYCALRRLSSMP